LTVVFRLVLSLLLSSWFLVVGTIFTATLGGGLAEIAPGEVMIYSSVFPQERHALVTVRRSSTHVIPLVDEQQCWSVSADARRLAVGDKIDRTVTVYDIHTRRVFARFNARAERPPCPLGFTPEGLIAYMSNGLPIWTVRASDGEMEFPPTVRPVLPPDNYNPPVQIQQLVTAPDGAHTFYARCYGTQGHGNCRQDWDYAIYDWNAGEAVARLEDADRDRLSMGNGTYFPPVWSADGRFLLYRSAYPDGDSATNLRLYDTESNAWQSVEPAPDGWLAYLPRWAPGEPQFFARLYPPELDGQINFGGDTPFKVGVYNLQTARWTVSETAFPARRAAAWSPSGGFVAFSFRGAGGEGLALFDTTAGSVRIVADTDTVLHAWAHTPLD
jgi:hypothetical protein